jgi:thioredoxin reductase (NADPH)
LYDVVVVGAGPAGLTAGMYCARGSKKTLILGNIYASQQSMGGLFENYPGFPEGIQGIELSERMLAQAEKYGAVYHPEQVQRIVHLDDIFKIKTESWEYESRALILATGASYRKLGVPGEDDYATKGVSYCAHCDGTLFRDRTVAVIGYGNGAARAVLYLAGICDRIHLLCTRERLGCEVVYQERIDNLSNFSAVYNAEIVQILGNDFVSGVEFGVNGKRRVLSVDGVFIEVGMSPNVVLAEDLGLEMTSGGFVRVSRLTQETSMLGMFAAGDICGGRMQVTTAVGAGASAAISAMRYLD